MARFSKRVWFRAKSYGWGWYPATWQGWVVILIYLLAFVSILVHFEMGVIEHHQALDIVIFIISELLLIAGLLLVCALTGEPPRWRWAGKEIRRRKRK